MNDNKYILAKFNYLINVFVIISHICDLYFLFDFMVCYYFYPKLKTRYDK